MRTCEVEGCGRKHVAKGYCRTHYSQQNPNHRRMIDHPCDGCGKVVRKEAARLNRYPTLYCTPKCKTATQHRALWLSRMSVSLHAPRSRRHAAITTYWQQQAMEQGRTFHAGYCRVCGCSYLSLYGDITCGDECATTWRADRKREAKHRRRALERNAYREPVSRTVIYARDDYTCQLCNEPLSMDAVVPHPHAPTIDHVVPLARGGTHEPNNVQAAHFICNSLKSDRLPRMTSALMATI